MSKSVNSNNLSSADFPKISIVTPSFNQAKFIEATIASVVCQNYPNLQYIVIDGCSHDGTQDVLKKYENQISYWVSEPDQGHGDAINKGFKMSDGEIMGWINSDDMLTPWSLHTIAEIFTKFPHVNWIQGYNSWWNIHGQMTHAKRNPKNIYDYLTLNYGWIQQESVFWRRSLWEKAGGYVSSDHFKFMIDGELWSRFFLVDKLYSLDCVLAGFRSHGNNRGDLNHAACILEMNKLVSIMKQKCSPEINKTANAIISLREIVDMKTFNLLRASGLIKGIATKYLLRPNSDVCYNRITWDYKTNEWIELTDPFLL